MSTTDTIDLVWRTPLKSTEKLLLLRIATHGGGEYQSEYAEACGISTRQVRNILSDLVKAGLILKSTRRVNHAYLYMINHTALMEDAA